MKSEAASADQMTKEIPIAVVAILGILTWVVASYGGSVPHPHAAWALYVVYVFGGVPLVYDLLKKVTVGNFGADLLAGISIVTAFILEQYLAGALVILMLSGGTALEQYATRRAAAVLQALAKRMPRTAHRWSDGSLVEVDLAAVAVGDTLAVLPHEICPVDGVVTAGHGSMDESYLTGEPFQISKVPGTAVLSGAVNGETLLTIVVEKLPVDSRYAKIMRVMEEAEGNRPAIRRIADRLGAWYTLVALIVAVLGWYIGGDPNRFLAVLVIATPCPLLIAIPVAIIGAVSQAASRGIIIKNPAMLERIDSCRTFIFDKTGTLTYGKPALTDIITAPDVSESEALRLAASVEQYSKHPLSQSIMAAAAAKNITVATVSEISERPGAGLQGRVDAIAVEITGRKQVLARGGANAAALPPVSTGMECVLLRDGHFAATFRFHDEPRAESQAFIGHLVPRHNATKVMLLSGDRKDEVTYLAGKVGITEIYFGKSPEEKVAIVRAETLQAPTLFVGDGINDAPAMQAATVGVAFGQNSDVTAESADAVVLDASLGKVDQIIHIGRRMRRIALQSAVGGMACSIVGMVLACLGYLPPVAGALAQELIDVVAVLNALRVVFPNSELDEVEFTASARGEP